MKWKGIAAQERQHISNLWNKIMEGQIIESRLQIFLAWVKEKYSGLDFYAHKLLGCMELISLLQVNTKL